jgi:hypothetical protein
MSECAWQHGVAHVARTLPIIFAFLLQLCSIDTYSELVHTLLRATLHSIHHHHRATRFDKEARFPFLLRTGTGSPLNLPDPNLVA